MTSKEKAKDLVLKFAFKGAQHEGEAKIFALIAVDETLKAAFFANDDIYNFYMEVKQEIEKL